MNGESSLAGSTVIEPITVAESVAIPIDPYVGSNANDSKFQPIKSYDGVFSNLNAKPEVMKIEPIGQYIDKPPSYSQAALNMPPTYQDALEENSVIEGMLIGIFLSKSTLLTVFR